ncbi:hypothetical protein SAMN05444398_1011050 [Roseovarius pacificus]|uniref:Uncharacterized protein n=1 Tax=Roseovarius pacificus TaxID=337701 RepID=A0A1M6YVT6_9RHOB|nr:hypothetical protein [Roseovarius pacificus]GGO50327.1 hypothetical protein GCM10011315_00830 [Roseovarius pacificus]SHL22159.1 hypothetical protein SAMN05444398_1011050 [Roseovarius pacificus]
MTDHANFLSIVEHSETVAARWAELVQKAVTDARERGVTLEPADCLDIRELRLAAMGNPLDEDNYQSELMGLPALSDAAMRKAIKEGDQEARAAAVADINRGKDTVHPDRQVNDAARRISRARELGIATPPPEQDSRSRSERLEALKGIASPAERLATARRWGLVA